MWWEGQVNARSYVTSYAYLMQVDYQLSIGIMQVFFDDIPSHIVELIFDLQGREVGTVSLVDPDRNIVKMLRL